jgi:alpha-methylacyl-CoA racemase
MRSAFREAFAQRDRDDWAAELGPADACVAPVLSIAELTEDPHLRARGVFGEALHPRHGRFRQVGRVLAGAAAAAGPEPVFDAADTQTEELLRDAGFEPREIDKLRQEGVVA